MITMFASVLDASCSRRQVEPKIKWLHSPLIDSKIKAFLSLKGPMFRKLSIRCSIWCRLLVSFGQRVESFVIGKVAVDQAVQKSKFLILNAIPETGNQIHENQIMFVRLVKIEKVSVQCERGTQLIDCSSSFSLVCALV